jgi:hypothetical protein
MADLRTAAQQALEALEKCSAQLTRLGYSANHADQVVPTVRAALEQPEQAEPVALQKLLHQVICGDFNADNTDDLKLALAARKDFAALQPRREWRGLTLEEVQDSYNADYQAQTRAIEAALRSKNHE